MKAIRYHGEARLELVHEVNYYTAVSRQLGERFDKAIQSAAIRAAEYPDLGSPFFYGTRRVLLKKFRFSVVYMASEDEILILAIAPFSRKPGHWRKRRNDGS